MNQFLYGRCSEGGGGGGRGPGSPSYRQAGQQTPAPMMLTQANPGGQSASPLGEYGLQVDNWHPPSEIHTLLGKWFMPHVLLWAAAHRPPPGQVPHPAHSSPGCTHDGGGARQGFGEQVPEPWPIPP